MAKTIKPTEYDLIMAQEISHHAKTCETDSRAARSPLRKARLAFAAKYARLAAAALRGERDDQSEADPS